MSNLLGCIREYSAESGDIQRSVLDRVQKNTLTPDKIDLPTAEHLAAIDSVLKELGDEKTNIFSQLKDVKMSGSKSAKLQTRIEELTGSIEDPATFRDDRIRYEKELDRIIERELNKDDSKVKGGSLESKYTLDKGTWKKVVVNGVDAYTQDNAVIRSFGSRQWFAGKVDEFGEYHSYGRYDSMEEAKKGLNSNTPGEQVKSEKKETKKEAKKEEKNKHTNSPEVQKELLEKVDVDKFVGMAINLAKKELRGDPEAEGVASEALVSAAKSFDREKAAKTKAAFSSFAMATARGELLTYWKKRSAIQAREVSSNTIDDGEGSVTETKIENVSEREIANAPKMDFVQKDDKVKSEPWKKIEVSDEEKARILASVKKKTLAEKQRERTEIQAKPDKDQDPAVEPEQEVDEAPKSIIVRKAPSSFLETKPKDTPPSVVKANEILNRAKGDTFEAIRVASFIRDPKERQEVVSHLQTIKSDTIGGVIRQSLIGLDKNSSTYKLATWLNDLLNKSGKGGIRIVVDPTLESEYFDPKGKGTVYLRDTTTDKITLHEVVHAITSRELAVNSNLRGKVLDAMRVVEAAVIADKTIKIGREDIRKMRSSGNTSASFQKAFGYEHFNGDRGVLYALLNEKEFLSQAMNDERFVEVLKGIDAPPGSNMKSMWDHIVDILKSVFGVSGKDSSMLTEVFSLIAETSQVDLSYGNRATIATIDGMMTGNATVLPNKGQLLDAQERAQRGEDLEKIRKDTGWFKDIDGEWKFEISDSGAILNVDIRSLDTFDLMSNSNRGLYRLEDILNHDKLFEAYPELKDLTVEIVNLSYLGEDVSGHFNPSDNSITLAKEVPQDIDYLETLLHEIQHVIQFKEDFALGGDVETVRLTKVADHMKSVYERVLSKTKDTNMALRIQAKLDILKTVKSNEARLDRLYKVIEDYSDGDPIKVMARSEISEIIEDGASLKNVQYDVYHLMLGEAEARNVGYRMKLGAKKLKQLHPYSTMKDVSEVGDLIVHRDAVDMADRVQPATKKDLLGTLKANSTRANIFEKVQDTITKKIPSLLKDATVGVTDRLREIAPVLATFQRRFEFEIVKYNSDYHEKAKGYIEKFKKMSKDDQLLLDYYLINDYPNDVEERWKLLKKYNMEKEYEASVEILKDIHDRKKKVALGDYEATPDYWPRRVIDVKELMQTMKDDPTYGVIQAELDKAGLEEADRQKAIQQMIHTGKYPALALLKPGSEKGRTIKRVSREWAHHYKSSVDSLIDHIYESNEAIAARNLFGDVARQSLVSKRDELHGKLVGLENEDKRRKIVNELTEIETKLNNYQEDWEDGIATMLSKEGHKFDAVQQQEIVHLIRARLLQKGMSGVMSTFRNLSIATVMGSPMSALTQLADLISPVHAFGIKHAAGSLFGNRVMTPKDLDLSHTMRDFQSGSSAKLVDLVLTISGVKHIDLWGKTVFMNSAISEAKSMTEAQFVKKWGNILGKEAKATYAEIKSGEKSDLTRFFAFNALSEYQPISISEMPMMYQEMQNGRIVYMLKSFNIKAINNIRNRIWVNARSAKSPQERRAAIADGLYLVSLLVIAGASVDELKDLIWGRDTDFSDHVGNNLLKLGLMNKFMLEKGDQRGMVKTMLSDTFIPPTKFMDDAYTDIRNLVDGDPTTKTTAKFLKSVPWGGLVYPLVSGDASKSNASMLKDRISSDAKRGASMSELREDITKYNRWAREAKETLITYDTIKKMKKREKDKIKKALAE